MKTFKTLLAVAIFIGMFIYVQSEEKKLKNATIYKSSYANKISIDSINNQLSGSNLKNEIKTKRYAFW